MYIEKPDDACDDAIRIGKDVVKELLGADGSLILSIDFIDGRNGDYLPLTRCMSEHHDWTLIRRVDDFTWEGVDDVDVETTQQKLSIGLNLIGFTKWMKDCVSRKR